MSRRGFSYFCWLLSLVLGATLSAAEVSSVVAETKSVNTLMREALAAEHAFDSKTALELFLQANTARPNDAAILQKISRQYSDLTIDTRDLAEKKRLCLLALQYAQEAVALDAQNPVNVLSLAICYGKLGLYEDTRTRIEYSRLVKQYADQALALNPDYAYAHHVLGRWNYEVATLGPAKRLIVRLIYGGLPPASTAEAVSHLRRAVQLAPALPSHRVELGFALDADGQHEAARAAFTEALALPTQEKYDEAARERARAALAN